MAALMTITVDDAALARAFRALPDATRRRVLDACQQTAERIAEDARGRLRRQVSGGSGQTAAGIEAREAFDGNGWVVLSDNEAMPNLPLWLEKGTRAGKRANFARTRPRPFFYAAVALEAGPHERRIVEAMTDAAAAVGLGE